MNDKLKSTDPLQLVAATKDPDSKFDLLLDILAFFVNFNNKPLVSHSRVKHSKFEISVWASFLKYTINKPSYRSLRVYTEVIAPLTTMIYIFMYTCAPTLW